MNDDDVGAGAGAGGDIAAYGGAPQPVASGSPKSPGKVAKAKARSTSPKSSPQSPNAGTEAAATAAADDGLLVVDHQAAAIEPGGPEEDDEFLFEEVDSGSTSVSSSILQHTFQNGRRYHKFRHGRYPIPNDDREQSREELLHVMMLEATDGRHFFAPISDNPQKIIDLGTGTGTWAIEVGDRYPSAEVIGLDLSPIQPEWVPANVQFVIDDVEDTWLAGEGFDFVHLRNMMPILKSPVSTLKNALAHMKPGAWVEMQDVDGRVHCDDGTLPDGWPLTRFCDLIVQAFGLFGTDSRASERGREYLEEAGFVNIQHHAIKLPYGPWPRDKTLRVVGMYYRIACEEMFPVIAAVHLPMLGWSEAESEVLFAQCRRGMRDLSVHAYGLMHFWSGQKPLEP